MTRKMLILGLAITFLTGCAGTTNNRLTGTIEATQIDIHAENAGKIVSFSKEEGQNVKAGEVIVTLDAESLKINVSQTEAVLASQKAKLSELRAGTRKEQLDSAAATVRKEEARLSEIKAGNRTEQIEQAQYAVTTAQNDVQAAQSNYDLKLADTKRIEYLVSAGAAPKQQLDDALNGLTLMEKTLQNAREKLNSNQANVKLLQSGSTEQAIQVQQAVVEQAQAQYALLKKGSTQQAIDAQIALVDQARANVDQAKLQVAKAEIKAPIDGVLLYKNVEIGQMVSVGTVLATVQKMGDYWVKVYLPQLENEKLTVGQKVKLSTTAVQEPIEGTVIFKAPKAEFTPRNTETKQAKEENTVIGVKIKLTSHVAQVSPGMLVDVLLDHGKE